MKRLSLLIAVALVAAACTGRHRPPRHRRHADLRRSDTRPPRALIGCRWIAMVHPIPPAPDGARRPACARRDRRPRPDLRRPGHQHRYRGDRQDRRVGRCQVGVAAVRPPPVPPGGPRSPMPQSTRSRCSPVPRSTSSFPWGQVTDRLIAWDLPAPPGYVGWKRLIFEFVEPGWAPFFDDADAAGRLALAVVGRRLHR